MYFVAVVSDAGDIGYVPLIVKAPKPTNRVAVLIPDHTWFAYDFFDDNRDGFPDSWYYRQGNDVVSLARPFAHSGMPWQFNSQMWPFLRWLRLHKAPCRLSLGVRRRRARQRARAGLRPDRRADAPRVRDGRRSTTRCSTTAMPAAT